MTKEKELYVGVTHPVESRKALLETSKEVIRALQGFERIRHVRHDKAEQITRLSKLVSEISASLEQLKADLPEFSPEDIPKQKVQKPAPSPEEKMARKPRLSELQKLENDLSSIEEKLKKL